MRLFSRTVPLNISALDAFLSLESGFTDQFVYYDTSRPLRYMGLGRCVAVQDFSEIECTLQGGDSHQPVFFSFNRFDEGNPNPLDPLFEAFPHLVLMLPELVIIEDEHGVFLQLNSLGPVSDSRIGRFVGHLKPSAKKANTFMPYTLESDSPENWDAMVLSTLKRIQEGAAQKVVLSRRLHLTAVDSFLSRAMLENLISSTAHSVVYLYRYDDVFFIGATPELLVRKQGDDISSMCLAGTAPAGLNEPQRVRFANELLSDDKNRREHDFVVQHLTSIFERTCHDIQVQPEPGILPLEFIQHLYTPISAHAFEDTNLMELMREFHPTPALCGYPVGEGKAVLRLEEPYNRGFFGGPIGFMDLAGNGEFSVAIRCGVFDEHEGFLYAGCGIVPSSVPEDEFNETNLKFRTILSALGGEGEE